LAVADVLVFVDASFLLEVNEVLQVICSSDVVLLSVRDHFIGNTLEKLAHRPIANPSTTKKKKVTYLKELIAWYVLQVQMMFFTCFKIRRYIAINCAVSTAEVIQHLVARLRWSETISSH
jgi:hypothetical protein